MLYRNWLQQNGVADDQIVYVNFEDFDMELVRTEQQLHQLFEQKLKRNQHTYILLDEIQNVEGWQRVVNGVRVSFDCDIVVTGSNAKMLSGELATLLSGRYVEIPIYPLSFREFLTAKEISPDSRQVDRAFREYEQFGGFPAVVLANDAVKDQVLQGIYDAVLLNDVSMRGGVRDPSVLRTLVGFLADNTGQLIQPTKISNILKSSGVDVSPHTINRYLTLLEDAFLFSRVRQYDLRGKQYLRTAGKYFIIDPGLRRSAVGRREGNYSNQLENIVFIELLRRGYRLSVGKLDSKEIDFVARKIDQVMYVQVTYALPENTHETDNLLMIKDNYRKIVITQQHYEFDSVAGIPIINVVDWLLDDGDQIGE
jgi:predicted AAA+ superfamily ATPase